MTELQLKIKAELEKNMDAKLVDIARKLNVSASLVGIVKQFIVYGKRKVECDYKKSAFPKIKIPAECPTCHIEHMTQWKGKIPSKPPKIYCPSHKGNRKQSDEHTINTYGESVVPVKSKNHTIISN